MESLVPLRLTEIFSNTYQESHGFLGLRKRPVTTTKEDLLMINWGTVQRIAPNTQGGSTLYYARTIGSQTDTVYAHVKETPEEIDKIVTAKLREIYGPE
jgi:hypothetical protein